MILTMILLLWSYDWMTFFYSSQSPALRSCCQSGDRIQFMYTLTPAVKCWLFCSITVVCGPAANFKQLMYVEMSTHLKDLDYQWRLCLSWATTWRKICRDSILIQKWCCQVNRTTSQNNIDIACFMTARIYFNTSIGSTFPTHGYAHLHFIWFTQCTEWLLYGALWKILAAFWL